MDESAPAPKGGRGFRFGVPMSDENHPGCPPPFREGDDETEHARRIADWINRDGDSLPKPPSDVDREMSNWVLSDGDSLPESPELIVAPAAGEDGAERDAGPRAWGFSVETLNREYALVVMGSKAVVLKEQTNGPFGDRRRFISLEAFRALLANRFTEIRTADSKVKAITWAQAWMQHPDRRQYQGVEFFPNPDGELGTPGYFNLWCGFAVAPSEHGTWHIFRDHLINNVCDGDAALFDWVFGLIAHIVQRPRERIGTALVLRGGMGVGKSKVGEVIGALFPAHYFPVDDPRYITGHFNAFQSAALLVQCEEAFWAGDKGAEGRIKGLITSSRNMIEQKGIDPIPVQNFVRVMMTSNEDWVVPAGMGERRFCVLDVNPRCAQNHDYFREMDEELAAGGLERLLFDLLHFDMSKVNLRQIPRTRALLEQKMRSLDPLHAWWSNCLMVGAQTRNADSWLQEVPVASLYDDYVRSCEVMGAGRKRDVGTFGTQMAKLAPGLARRQVRRRYNDSEQARRVWVYSFPSLIACRNAFDTLIGQDCEWPATAASESEAGGEEVDSDDFAPG
jgi:hypothetical protein